MAPSATKQDDRTPRRRMVSRIGPIRLSLAILGAALGSVLLTIPIVGPASGQASPSIESHSVRYSVEDSVMTIELASSGESDFRQVFVDVDQSSLTGYLDGYDLLVENGNVFDYAGVDGQPDWIWSPNPAMVEGSTGASASADVVRWSLQPVTSTASRESAMDYLVRVVATGSDDTSEVLAEQRGTALVSNPADLTITSAAATYNAAADSVTVSFNSTGPFDRKIVLIDSDLNPATGYGEGFDHLIENGRLHRHEGQEPTSWQWTSLGPVEGPTDDQALVDNVQWTFQLPGIEAASPIKFVVEQDNPNRQVVELATLGGESGVGGVLEVDMSPFRPTDDNTVFANPERGLYLYSQLLFKPELGSYQWSRESAIETLIDERSQGRSLFILLVELETEVDNAMLSDAVLNALDSTLKTVDRNGFKVIFRARYKDGIDGPDEPLMGRIQDHVRQLSAVIRANRSAVAYVEAGMIGAWGEWNTSGTFPEVDQLDGAQAVADNVSEPLLNTWLEELPDMFVGVRRPRFKADANLISPQRVGHYNDCFLWDKAHRGTYDLGVNLGPDDARGYLQGAGESPGDTAFVPIGGEPCGLADVGANVSNENVYRYAVDADGQPYGSTTANDVDQYTPEYDNPASYCIKGQQALQDYRFTYLNNRIDPEESAGIDSSVNAQSVWPARWRQGGCWDDVQRRLGYRFDLERVQLSGSLTRGSRLEIALDIENEGFARLYRSRAVELVFLQNDREIASVPLDAVDPSRWTPGTTVSESDVVIVPEVLNAGQYQLGLRLADPDSPANYLQAIRFANDGWDGANGLQLLGDANVQVFDEPTTIVAVP